MDEGWSSSISLDGNGYPHISYNGSLKYAYRDDVGWYIQEFGDCCSTGGSSIALDGDGYPHISYPTFGDFEGLKYTYKDTAGWHIRLVVSEIGDSSSTSLVLDKDEFPHTYL